MVLSLTFSSLPLNSTGEAEAILARAQATAKGIVLVSDALKETGGVEVSFSLELQVSQYC